MKKYLSIALAFLLTLSMLTAGVSAQAENKLADLKYNRSQAESAVEKINAIGEVTLNSREAIAKARAAYDALLVSAAPGFLLS